VSAVSAELGTREGLGAHVDFDLHGIVGVRVLDARPRDVETVTRQLGPIVAPLDRPPDITVRFVDEIPDRRPMTYGTWPDSAATDDAFYLLRGKEGVAARTLFPMDAVGERCEIVCERRVGPVPHLLAVVNMTALTKGVLPLHASAFTYRGAGVLATGWAKGGKTETLLAFAARGARYVGDEWVYLTPDGGMCGVPEPIRLWYWHVQQMPELQADLPRATRARLAALPGLARSAASLGGSLPGLPASALRRVAPVVRRQAFVQVPPARLFGEDAIALQGRLDHVLLVTSTDRDEVTVEPVSGASVAARMAASLEDERSMFMQLYRQFRFLFPERRSAAVEQAPGVERRLESLVGPVESVLGAEP
jgi:hypothetical protein